LLCIGYQISTGVGVWGLNSPVGWAWDITNFVWWIGIGHAGTLISAILLLFRQRWRMSINRAAEAMTIFAVICAASFPAFHMGRLWLGFYWALPLPNAFGSLWVNFNSPLLWDVFAISTYFTVSLVFWYIGLIPDLATLRDRATSRFAQIVYGFFAMGWRGSAKHWLRYDRAYLLLAALAILSVAATSSFEDYTEPVVDWSGMLYKCDNVTFDYKITKLDLNTPAGLTASTSSRSCTFTVSQVTGDHDFEALLAMTTR
jgi:molybdopterin-containing oxidoreductase family membrane subunit